MFSAGVLFSAMRLRLGRYWRRSEVTTGFLTVAIRGSASIEGKMGASRQLLSKSSTLG